jgi:methionyl-tRNA synthetase
MTEGPRFIVTSAPPNPNGDLHLGHLAGPFLGADVLARYLRQAGRDVVHVGYADDYSCYVTRKASELERPAAEVAHVFGARMEQTLSLGNMPHDYFTHPLREPIHGELVQRLFGEMWQRGAFEVHELPAYWCTGCDRYLYEAEMRGSCQFCASPSDGVYCEECGRPQETTGLRNPRCTRCGTTDPEVRMQRRIVFPLEKYRSRLRGHYADQSLRPRLRGYLDDMFSRPLPATPVSRVACYGIPVPLDGWDGNILDTWYSGIFGYIAATVAHEMACGNNGAGLAAWMRKDTEVAHFFGFDCSFSHTILWPALLMAHGGLTLPDRVITNEFYRLEGEKFSTSRGHAIWGNDVLRRVPADLLRFYLCLTGPETEFGNFAAKDFTQTVNDQVVGPLAGWIGTVFAQAARAWGGLVPEATPQPSSALADLSRSLPARLQAALDPAGFSPRRAAEHLLTVFTTLPAAAADLVSESPAAQSDRDALLVSHLELLAVLAAVAAPIMPAFSSETAKALGLRATGSLRPVLAWPSSGERLVPAGRRISTDPPVPFQPVVM